jgi:hypothetical protein
VSGVGGGVGNSLVEIYDIDPGAPATIRNISTRAVVGTGDEVMIGGLIVSGSGTQKVVIRAMGPSLTQHGVAGALANPAIRVVNNVTNEVGSGERQLEQRPERRGIDGAELRAR